MSDVDPRTPLAWMRASMPAISIRHLLAALVLVTAVPLMVLALVLYQQTAMSERQAVRDGLMSDAGILAALVENEIDTHLAIAATLAASPTLQIGDLAAFARQAKQALEIVPGAWLRA